MPIPDLLYRRHSCWIKKVAVVWLNTLHTEPARHRKAEQLLREWGFCTWDFLDLFDGAISIIREIPPEFRAKARWLVPPAGENLKGDTYESLQTSSATSSAD